MGTDVEDIVTFCEETCQQRCHLRVPAEELDEDTSCGSASKTRRYRKHGSRKPSKEGADTAMEMTLSPFPGCSVLRLIPRDIILATLRIVPT